MDISIKSLKTVNKITIKGELTIYQAEESARILFEDLSLFEKPIKVDLSAVTEIDTAGIQILLMLKRQMCVNDFTISHINETVSAVVGFLGLSQSLIEDSTV